MLAERGVWREVGRSHVGRTFDFSTMYTNIPHESLLDNLASLVNKAFAFARVKRYIVVVRGERLARWTEYRDVERKGVCWDEDELMRAVRIVVLNAVVCVGHGIYHQILGAPMGTNSSPPLANLYLLAYERNFMHSLCLMDRFEVARAFANTCRFLDDILFLANPFVDQYLHFEDLRGQGLYPSDILRLEETTLDRYDDPGHLHYLDLDLWCGESLRIRIWDKRKQLDIPIIRFPHRGSALAESAMYAIVTSQCFRFFRILKSRREFLQEVVNMMTTLVVDKGYSRPRVLKKVKCFLWMVHELFSGSWFTLWRSVRNLYRECERVRGMRGVC